MGKNFIIRYQLTSKQPGLQLSCEVHDNLVFDVPRDFIVFLYCENVFSPSIQS